MTLFLRALCAAIRAAEAARMARASPAAGAAADGLADARCSLDEALELLQRRPEVPRAALAWCEAVGRTKALVAAIQDLQVHHAPDDVLADAYIQHTAAKRAEAAALWALREEL